MQLFLACIVIYNNILYVFTDILSYAFPLCVLVENIYG